MKWILSVICVGLIAVNGYALSIGDMAPPITDRPISGKPLSLQTMQKQVVLVDVWATWCPPCVQSIPVLVSLYKKYESKGLKIIGLSVDREKSDVRSFLAKMPIPYPIIVDSKATEYTRVDAIPTVYIIGRDGKIKDILVGFHSQRQLEERLIPLMKSL